MAGVLGAQPPCDRCGYARTTLDLRLDTMSCREFHALPCRCSQRQGVEEGVPIEKLLRRSASEYTTSKPNDVDDRTVISRRKRPRGSVYGPLVLLICSLVPGPCSCFVISLATGLGASGIQPALWRMPRQWFPMTTSSMGISGQTVVGVLRDGFEGNELEGFGGGWGWVGGNRGRLDRIARVALCLCNRGVRGLGPIGDVSGGGRESEAKGWKIMEVRLGVSG